MNLQTPIGDFCIQLIVLAAGDSPDGYIKLLCTNGAAFDSPQGNEFLNSAVTGVNGLGEIRDITTGCDGQSPYLMLEVTTAVDSEDKARKLVRIFTDVITTRFNELVTDADGDVDAFAADELRKILAGAGGTFDDRTMSALAVPGDYQLGQELLIPSDDMVAET